MSSDKRLRGIVPDDDETLQHLAGHTSTALELGEPPPAHLVVRLGMITNIWHKTSDQRAMTDWTGCY